MVADKYLRIVRHCLFKYDPWSDFTVWTAESHKRDPRDDLKPMEVWVRRGCTEALGSFTFADDNAWGIGSLYIMGNFNSANLAAARIDAQDRIDRQFSPYGAFPRAFIYRDDSLEHARAYLKSLKKQHPKDSLL